MHLLFTFNGDNCHYKTYDEQENYNNHKCWFIPEFSNNTPNNEKPDYGYNEEQVPA